MPDKKDIEITELKHDLFSAKQIRVSVLRLDKLNPVVSGNKLFKLHYFLNAAKTTGQHTIITFGGAYSNHLVATAFAGKEAGFTTIGIVRGERPPTLSHTLLQCLQYGMQLQFISRQAYDNRDSPEFINQLNETYGTHALIPEGGYHPLGAKGAGLIMDLTDKDNYSYIACATGTATTLAGLLMHTSTHQLLLGISVLKGITDIPERLQYLMPDFPQEKKLLLLHDHSFGGYAKRNNELIRFMNDLYMRQQLPTDFVYTGKMMFAVYAKATENFFQPGSHILCIHTGGLQGNGSLPENTLVF